MTATYVNTSSSYAILPSEMQKIEYSGTSKKGLQMASKPQPDEVKRILRPYEAQISDSFLKAWDRWWRNPERADLRYRRVRACLLHQYTMNDAIPALKAREGVEVHEKHETAFFLIAPRLVFRMKKGNESGLTSNISSQASLAFTDPDETFPLFPELPNIWRVDIAYVLNALETLIEQVLVVARDEDRILWSYQIYGSAAEGEAPIAPTVLPFPPRTPPPAGSGMRIPESENDKKKKKEEGE